MIIALRGKIGSGKDTAARYILEYICREKHPSEGRFIHDSIFTLEEYSNWNIKKIALTPKLIAAQLLGISVHKFEDQEFKKTQLGPEWGSMTVREFLIKIPESLKSGVHPDIWINTLLKEYSPIATVGWVPSHNNPDNINSELPSEMDYPNWIITDFRFKNEYDKLQSVDAVLVEIDRPNNPHPRVDHPSETELDGVSLDFVISNSGSLDSFKEEVFRFCELIKL